jgi:hypothetical protein
MTTSAKQLYVKSGRKKCPKNRTGKQTKRQLSKGRWEERDKQLELAGAGQNQPRIW